jgi:hypothetical protein
MKRGNAEESSRIQTPKKSRCKLSDVKTFVIFDKFSDNLFLERDLLI